MDLFSKKINMVKICMSLLVFVVSAVGLSILYAKPASADWYSDLGVKYTVYQKGNSYLYWNGRDNSWKILNGTIPQVRLDGKSCSTADDNSRDFNSPKVFNNCTGLEVTARTESAWFNEANLAFRIGDFDSKETVSVDGGRITQKGNLNQVTIASNGRSAKSASSGCSGGNPNKSQGCSILIVFNYGYGNSFKIDLDNEWNGANRPGSSGHEFYYDGPSLGAYRTLTFRPNGGSVVDNSGDGNVLWSHTSGANVQREYVRGKTASNYPIPTRVGYTFAGWYTAASGGSRAAASRSMTSDEDYYAQWIPSTTTSYALTPGITVSGDTAITPGQPAVFIPSVTKTGNTASNIHWELARVLVPAGASIDMSVYSATGSAAVCARYAVPATCTITDQGDNVTFSAAVTALNSITDSDTAGLAVGSRLCYALLVSPYTETGNNYRQAISCVLVAATPTVQVLGNDLRTGSGFMGAANTESSIAGTVSTRSASWVEYAIMGASDVTRIASQSGAINGSSDGQSAWSKLTFANVDTPGDCASGFGCFTSPTMLGKIPDIRAVVSSFSIARQVGGSISASGIPSLLGGGINLNSFTGSVAIVAGGDITIDQDIIYNPGTLSSKEDIPQLILIGDNITILGSVQRVDAWLIARGTVNTCSDVTELTDLRTTNCNNRLQINGTVMASELKLSRTYQNTSNPSQAAETINLRGDAYIWANMMSRRNGNVQTTYITELPPRY